MALTARAGARRKETPMEAFKYILKRLILVPMILMSLATGLAKVRQQPQETQFSEDIGLSLALLMVLGGVQVIGALVAMYPKTVKKGAAVMGLGFIISAALIFLNSESHVLYISILGYISLISAVLCAVLAYVRWDV